MPSSKICYYPHTKHHPSYCGLASVWLGPKESEEVAFFSSDDHHFVKEEFGLTETPRDFKHLGFILVSTKKVEELCGTHRGAGMQVDLQTWMTYRWPAVDEEAVHKALPAFPARVASRNSSSSECCQGWNGGGASGKMSPAPKGLKYQ